MVPWRFPALPAPLAAFVRAQWSIDIVADDDAADPRAGSAFSALLAHARTEQIVRALARRTNLVLPAATVLVVGDGGIAETLATTLSAGGSRVVRAIHAPIPRLRAHLRGGRTADPSAPWPAADLVITTGEGHAPLDPAALHAVTIDAALDGTGLTPASGESVRPFVQRVADASWSVAAPGPYETGDGSADHPNRLADLLVALSILRAHGDGDGVRHGDGHEDDADTRLARLVLS